MDVALELSANLLKEDKFEYALRFKFQASNNEAEYEALLAGIRMCKAAGAKKINACSDSQLIVSQVNGDYEATHPVMVKYLAAVKKEAGDLEDFHVSQIPRSENSQADALSKLASSASCDAPDPFFGRPWKKGQSKRSMFKRLTEAQPGWTAF